MTARPKLKPNRPVLVINEQGPTELPMETVNSTTVGWKVVGLASLPKDWTPSFFVIDGQCLAKVPEQRLSRWVENCLKREGIANETVIVRSSGSHETIKHRGRLPSKKTSAFRIVDTLKDLVQRLEPETHEMVHWVISSYLRQVETGHFSNERHLVKEPRDWVAEIGHRTIHIGHRKWRSGTGINMAMTCFSEKEITLRLRNIAAWGVQYTDRLHFEWVWDGKTLWVVQADISDPKDGINPTKTLHSLPADISSENLTVFRIASDNDYKKYNKLRNADTYRELKYDMPPFYVVDDNKVVDEIMRGQCPQDIINDLEILTKGSLVIRTDGDEIPKEKREMLPRSEELRSVDEAVQWLTSDFKSKIAENGLIDSQICLIAHHFVPSTASAWARAVPGNRTVRIESIWGIPEGLYWYSHDTFEVDLGPGVTVKPGVAHSIRKKERYKGSFITPDKDGRWKPQHTAAPYDWRSSIKKDKWLSEIAFTSRSIADYEKFPVIVMWFVDVDTRVITHNVLPWYHTKSEFPERLNAAPRRKFSTSNDHKIANSNDWITLQEKIKHGGHIVRIIVHPDEFELIRNLKFVEELAHLAADRGIVIELEGGILSHAYYALIRGGAQVQCVDLFGADDEVIEFDKLVRDKIPKVVSARGEHVSVIRLADDALIEALRQKLIEEAFEVLDAQSGVDMLQELADVQEVVNSIVTALNEDLAEIEEIRVDKKKGKGGFECGYVLKQTSKPGSLSDGSSNHLELMLESENNIIADPNRIPSKPFYQRPDLRRLNNGVEKLFIFQTPLNRIATTNDPTQKTIEFSIPIGKQNLDLKLTLEFSRQNADLHGKFRLKVDSAFLDHDNLQLELDFQIDD